MGLRLVCFLLSLLSTRKCFFRCARCSEHLSRISLSFCLEWRRKLSIRCSINQFPSAFFLLQYPCRSSCNLRPCNAHTRVLGVTLPSIKGFAHFLRRLSARLENHPFSSARTCWPGFFSFSNFPTSLGFRQLRLPGINRKFPLYFRKT